MRQWIPVSSSPKGRLVLAAVAQFGSRPFEAVTVGELAEAAGVTTGAIYHHFGSKLGLYSFVRADVEQRLVDRMSGAMAASDRTSSSPTHSARVATALLVGFDFASHEGLLHLVGAPPVGTEHDRLSDLLAASTAPSSPVLGPVLAAAWRAALLAVSDGADPQHARDALSALGPQV